MVVGQDCKANGQRIFPCVVVFDNQLAVKQKELSLGSKTELLEKDTVVPEGFLSL